MIGKNLCQTFKVLQRYFQIINYIQFHRETISCNNDFIHAVVVENKLW